MLNLIIYFCFFASLLQVKALEEGCQRISSDSFTDGEGNEIFDSRWVDVKCEGAYIPKLNSDFLYSSVIDLTEFIIAQADYSNTSGPHDAARVVRPSPTYNVVLQNADIEDIEDGTFEILPSMQSLDVSSNKLTKLRPGMFQGLNNLQDLFLGKNKIKDLDFAPFNYLEHLQFLELSENEIQELKFYNFKGLRNSHTLHLNRNNITKVNPGAFAFMRTLENLFASDNRITTLDGSMLAGLYNLRYLILTHNNIVEIYDGAFRGMKNLEALILKSNLINTLTTRTFEGLSNIRKIDLSNNKIIYIDGSPFADCPLLEELDLSHNGLPSLHMSMFRGLLNIKFLTLSKNWMHETAAILSQEKNPQDDELVEAISLICRFPGLQHASLEYNGLEVLLGSIPKKALGFDYTNKDQHKCSF